MMHAMAAMLATGSAGADLARSPLSAKLHPTQSVWQTHGVLSDSAVAHVLGKLPNDETGLWHPCVGQVAQFASKRCTLLPVKGDIVLHAALASIEAAWGADLGALHAGGLPIIRYLPGAPAVGVHGDRGASGLVPNATLVVYLTDGEAGSGETVFPALGLKVSPKRGSVLSFMNVGPGGAAENGHVACSAR